MNLENHQDLSVLSTDVGAGFQFEFHCMHCTQRWKTPFKSHRLGHFTGMLSRVSYLFNSIDSVGRLTGNLSEMSADGARKKALAAAMEQARTMYERCGECTQIVCHDCWDSRAGVCANCSSKTAAGASGAGGGSAPAAASRSGGATAGATCPNCRSPASGGRFCAECGFDMASTHKTCPGCSALVLRQTRFCADCGHGF